MNDRARVRSSRFAGWRDRLEGFHFAPYARYIVAGLVLALYIAATTLSGSRQLWYDELHTYYIARAPSLGQLFRELNLDLNPPLEYLAVRASLAVLGDHAYAARLPSIVGFLVGSVCFYRFVSKRLRPVYGLLALLVFWATPFFSYATEARPYALVVGWFGLAMLAWDATSKPDRSRASVLMLGLAVTGMMLSHLFSLFFIAPFCLAEAWRLYRTRKFDWAVWAALLVPGVIAIAFLQLLAQFEATLFPPAFEASPRKLGAFYYHTLVPEAPALVAAIAVALLAGYRSKQGRAKAAAMNGKDIAFTVGLLALPEVLMLLLMATHGAFFPRYAILAAFGYALVLAFGVALFTNRSRFAAAAACCVLFLYDAGAIRSAYRVHRIQEEWPAEEAAIAHIRPDLPLVVSSGFTFLEMGKYASPSTTSRLYYLSSPDLGIKYAHATMFRDFASRRQYFPMKGTIEPYRQFTAEHPHFLVFGTPGYVENWLFRWLDDVHATVRPAGIFPGPYSDYQLFEITLPGASDSAIK